MQQQQPRPALLDAIHAAPAWSIKTLQSLVATAKLSMPASPPMAVALAQIANGQSINALSNSFSNDIRDYMLPSSFSSTTSTNIKSKTRIGKGKKLIQQQQQQRSLQPSTPSQVNIAQLSHHPAISDPTTAVVLPLSHSSTFSHSTIINLHAPIKLSSLGINKKDPDYLDRAAKMHKVHEYARRVRESMMNLRSYPSTTTVSSYTTRLTTDSIGNANAMMDGASQHVDNCVTLPPLTSKQTVKTTQSSKRLQLPSLHQSVDFIHGHKNGISKSSSNSNEHIHLISTQSTSHNLTVPLSKTSGQTSKPHQGSDTLFKAQEKRQKMKQYASRIPKPRLSLLPTLSCTNTLPTNSRSGSNALSNSLSNPLTRSSILTSTYVSSTSSPSAVAQEISLMQKKYYSDMEAFDKIKRELGIV